MSKNRDQEEESGSDYTTVSSDPSDLQPQGSLFGNLKTRLRWVPSSKQMHLDVRQNLQTRRNLEFRYKCTLNTNTGSYQYIAQLQKNLHQNTPSLARLIAAEQGITLRGEKPIDPDRFLPGGLPSLLWRDWTASPGIRFSSHPSTGDSDSVSSSAGSSPKYFVSLKKQPQVLRRQGLWDSWLTGKADIELDPHQQRIGVAGTLRLKVFRFNITDKQNLQLQCGTDFRSIASESSSSSSDGGSSSNSCKGLTPYVKVGDNNWTMRLQHGGWSFNYEI